MGGFGVQSEILCDGMMETYINSNRYGTMEDHAIARIEKFRKGLNDNQCKEFNQIIDEVNIIPLGSSQFPA